MSKLTANGRHTGISGTIDLSGDLAAAGEYVVSFNLSNVNPTTITYGSSAQSGYRLANDGYAYQKNTFGWVQIAADFIDPKSETGTGIHVRMVKLSGSTVSGPTGWVDTSVDREWTLTRSTPGTFTASYRAEVSDDGGTTVRDSATINFTSTYHDSEPP